MATLKPKSKDGLQNDVASKDAELAEMKAHIKQLQDTIGGLQKRVELSVKENEVNRNLRRQKAIEAAINPDNLATKIRESGLTPAEQEQVLKNAR
jgi:sialic acid synthase SpsE